MTAEYFVKIDKFEGPLDLLVHLIRVHEIDIFDINVYKLTTEYLEYLRLMQYQDLAVAGEFLEMAATLTEIKTRMLLPHDNKRDENDDADDDPIRDLQERLLQHELFRGVAEYLGSIPQLGVELQPCNEWRRLEPLLDHIEAPLTGDATTMVVLYEQMLRTLVERRKAKVKAITHKISVEEAITKLEAEIETSKFALFQGYYNRFKDRYDLVVYVLAMLELSKMHKINVYQQDLMGPIWMYRSDCDESILPLENLAVPSYMGGESQSETIDASAVEAPTGLIEGTTPSDIEMES